MRRGSGVAGFVDVIPPLNAAIVAVVGVLLVAGWVQVRRGRVRMHRALMVSATTLFGVFLVLYGVRMVLHGPTSFASQNPAAPELARWFYYGFLGVHMVLAVVTIALIPVVIHRAWRARWRRHRRLARKVVPLWLVSIVMGIAVYGMLFHWP